MKIVLNKCFGGFSLSDKACKYLYIDDKYYYTYACGDNVSQKMRTETALVKCIEELGEEANGSCASLGIVEIPDEATDWEINEYDGLESVTYVLDGKIHHV